MPNAEKKQPLVIFIAKFSDIYSQSTPPRHDGQVVKVSDLGCRLHVTLWPGVRMPVLPRVICGFALSRRLSSSGWPQST